MKKLLLAATVLGVLVNTATADTFFFTQSNIGPGVYGQVTTTDLGGNHLKVEIDMAPNYILNTGGHLPLAFTLDGAGTINAQSLEDLNGVGNPFNFTALTKFTGDLGPPPPFGSANSPFQYFRDGITGDCGSGGSAEPGHNCGQELNFIIDNFSGFSAASTLFNGLQVFAAMDIFNVATNSTFAVGLVDNPIHGGQCTSCPVPGPAVGAGLPGLIASLFGLLGFSHWRRRRLTA